MNSKRTSPLKFAALLLIILLTSVCLGCAGSLGSGGAEDDSAAGESGSTGIEVAKTVLLYPVNRILDVLDIFRLNVAAGPGFGLNLRATKFVQAGFENYVSVRAGLGKGGGMVFPRYGLLYSESELMTLGAGPAYTGGGQRGFTEVGGTVHVGIVGAEVAVDLMEFVDALAGFIMLDPQGDDL